ncbi:MAG: type II secretion system protein M [Gemmatimonadetes bacterium]|nr:type II secretion system protein M [Gemmatimonadota bacterium]
MRFAAGARRMSTRDRRALWLGALVVVPVLAWRAVVAPVAAGVQRAHDDAATQRGLLAREKALLRDAPLLPARAKHVAERAAVMAPRLFNDADTVAASAALSAFVRDAARSAGLRVTQTDAAPVEIRGAGVVALGVDTRVEGTFGAIVSWLDQLESGERVLTVERFEVTATGTSEGTIAASARVRGFGARLGRTAKGRGK